MIIDRLLRFATLHFMAKNRKPQRVGSATFSQRKKFFCYVSGFTKLEIPMRGTIYNVFFTQKVDFFFTNFFQLVNQQLPSDTEKIQCQKRNNDFS